MLEVTIAHMVIVVIVVAALLAIVFVAVKGMGLNIPPWVMQIFWIVVIAVVCIFAVKLILSMV